MLTAANCQAANDRNSAIMSILRFVNGTSMYHCSMDGRYIAKSQGRRCDLKAFFLAETPKTQRHNKGIGVSSNIPTFKKGIRINPAYKILVVIVEMLEC